jgi:diguanylate cyclase (GGDEF)-like protein
MDVPPDLPPRPEAGSADNTGGAERDDAADERDQVADDRDDAGDLRDDAADVRDLASGRRDVAALRRDEAADLRDVEAARREQAADAHEHPTAARASAARHAEAARNAAASDRERASLDRSAGAGEREDAQRDRATAQADRSFGAGGRNWAGDDRGASARDREDASLDGLTGAYVRGAGLLQLERELDRARRTSEPLTIAFVDVDHLKVVNDSGGHAAGDRLLVRVVAALRSRLRSYDLVVRYGGDEFVCVLADVPAAETEARFALVNDDLAGHGSVTVGVVTAGPDEDVDALLARADASLYALRATRT